MVCWEAAWLVGRGLLSSIAALKAQLCGRAALRACLGRKIAVRAVDRQGQACRVNGTRKRLPTRRLQGPVCSNCLQEMGRMGQQTRSTALPCCN